MDYTEDAHFDLTAEQQAQEEEYNFPYHFIPSFQGGRFSQVKALQWGCEYLSYINYVLKKAETIGFNSLLDIGCGDGRFLYEVFKKHPRKKLVGVDYSKKAINLAKAMSENVEYVYGDIKDKDFIKKKFDIVTLIDTLEHIPPEETEKFIRGIYDHTNDDGTFIITVPSTNLKICEKHYKHFNFEILSESLQKYFMIVDVNYINKKTFFIDILQSFYVNKLFIINANFLMNIFFDIYKKYFFHASINNCKRICALCKKKI